MPRLMSCALTIPQVRARTKTVTRRRADSWRVLKVGDRLTLVEKGQGIPTGGHVVRLAEVEVVDVRVEQLRRIVDPGELEAEGFPDMLAMDFAEMWARSHGWRGADLLGEIECRRIEWRYL